MGVETETFESLIKTRSDATQENNLASSSVNLLIEGRTLTATKSDKALGLPDMELVDSSNSAMKKVEKKEGDANASQRIIPEEGDITVRTFKTHKDNVVEERESDTGVARKFANRNDGKIEEFEYKPGKGPEGLKKTEKYDDGGVRKTYEGRTDGLQRETDRDGVVVRNFDKNKTGGKVKEITYNDDASLPYEGIQKQVFHDDGKIMRSFKGRQDGMTRETVFKEEDGREGTSKSFKDRPDGKTYELTYKGPLEEGQPRKIEHIKGAIVSTYDDGRVEKKIPATSKK